MRSLRWGAALTVVAGALAALPGGASANVQVGSSGWLWGNPLPQGNTLRAMTFAGTTGFAVGDFGTLLKTADGGASWSGLPAGTFSNLSEVQALDANTVVAGGGCVARLSTDGGATFSRIAFTPVESDCPADSNLAAMWFTSATHGYVVEAKGLVFETTDGGSRFTARTALPGTRTVGGGAAPTDIVFVSDTAGFATTSDGNIYGTVDSGVNWRSVSNTNRSVNAIVFVSPSTGYAVGDQSLLLKTTDGGATWNAKAVGGPGPQNLTSIRCATDKLCVVTTSTGTSVGVTTDGAETPLTFSSPSTDPIHAAAFATPTRLAAVGEQGSTVVSDDAGVTYHGVGGRLIGSFTRVRAGRVPGSAFAPGPDGTLGRTIDGGKTWTRGNVTTSQDVRDVSFPTNTDGYALDVAGGLFTTNDGGGSWATLNTGSTARPNAVYAPDAKTVMVIGPTGVRRSVDAGGSFDNVKGAVARAPLAEVDRAGTAVVVYGPQDLLRSTDAGKTWAALRKPGRYVRRGRKLVNRLGIRGADFADATHGFMLDTNGRLYRTANGGKSWQELPGVGTDQATSMSFSSARRGYLVINRFGDVRRPTGFLLRTDDGGTTWHPQFVVSTPIAQGGVAAGAGTDYLLGGAQSLLYSTAGGDSGSASDLTITAPKARYTKPAHIVVTGKLKPAQGNERVTVSWRRPGSTRWHAQTVTVSANGSFTSSWNLAKGTNLFVAQWQGDFRSHGDGSKVLTVKVGKATRK
ncbi:WD40/YVTN/BNR-like repeat-containing protein [Baekduia soli]|nr:YCF48-related protein [Baekduia soli]